MVDPRQVQHHGEAIRRETIALLDQLSTLAAGYDLPDPPLALTELRRKLVDDRYTVLVAGEAKRGKSSFVNAMIGRRVSPVDVQVATSQVFRIQRSEPEA
ncbi:MAG: dynamin family protein [Thermomicrobiales bacterium]